MTSDVDRGQVPSWFPRMSKKEERLAGTVDLPPLSAGRRLPPIEENLWPLSSITNTSAWRFTQQLQIPEQKLTPDELSEIELEDVKESVSEVEAGKAKRFRDVDEAFSWLSEEP